MSAVSLQENPRTARKARIKRASARARADMNKFDAKTLKDLDQAYRQAAADLARQIQGYAGRDGSLRLEVLQDLLGQVNARLRVLETARNRMLEQGLEDAARLGVVPFAGDAGISGQLTKVADEAARFVRTFVAADGLQLSDRLWRIDRGAERAIAQAIETHIIQGHSASRAAEELLAQGEPVPKDIADKVGMAKADRVARASSDALLRDEGSARANALRLFRTELNRAHGEAYRAAAVQEDGVIGTRFLLSPNHPETDICDMHATVNRYGLGPGVYPPGKSPWPAHPNTLSYEEVVFADEISTKDRQGKEDRIDWLKQQPGHIQEAVLGGRKKRAALQRGILTEGQIATPWNALKIRYQRQGVDVEALAVRSEASLPAIGPAVGLERARDDARRYVLEQGERTNFEHAVIIDLNGGREVFRKTTRNRKSVSFDRHELALFFDGRNRFELFHNHPRSSSLSVADLRMGTLPGIESVIAVGHDGTIFTARSLVDAGRIVKASDLIDNALMGRITPLVAGRTITPDQASALHSHLQNLALQRLEMIDYRVDNVSGNTRAALAVVGESFVEDILRALYDMVRR